MAIVPVLCHREQAMAGHLRWVATMSRISLEQHGIKMNKSARQKHRTYCCDCEKQITADNRHPDDPDFCKVCFDKVEEMINNPMPHMGALVALTQCGWSGTPHNEGLAAFGFMSIMHPRMPVRRRMQIAKDIEENSRRSQR